jgi:transglutaminase-like putative cysteine protease
MRYVSPEGRLVGPDAAFDTSHGPAALWDRARESMGGGRFMSAVLVLLLTLTVARSTATVGWVDGIDVITWVALAGAILMGALALLPVREPISLGVGLLLAPVVAFFASWAQIRLRHPGDVVSPQLVSIWWERINIGEAGSDTSFYLILICLLMWVTGAWLAWCVFRWRKPMLGLIPGAAAFATNVLNVPQDQNGYTLAMLVLTLALLLWTNYTGSLADAARASVKLTGDARWDFWESGLVAMAALIVLGIMLPPLSTADRTLEVESGMFTNWAQLQQRLSHPGFFNSGPSTGVTGFTDYVQLTGQLQRTRDIVFTYQVTDFSGARYFRGVNATLTLGGMWRYPAADSGLRRTVSKNDVFVYGEEYEKLAVGAVNVRMLRPPVNDKDVLFYPGLMYKIDRLAMSTQVPNPAFGQSAITYTIDRLSSVQPATSSGNYVATVEYSIATANDLESAGTDYPEWLGEYSSLPTRGYRTPFVEREIHDLAVSIVTAANATTPYDQAHAIELYLRDPSKFTYSLDARVPAGVDPIEYFLFTSKKGYCEFFATAMGDMLRSLGIPTRLVNGFGPGTYDNQTQQYIVRGEDAHTWVEVYFPKYGWIPFEPTADNQSIYQSIPRGASGATCLRDNGCDTPTSGGATIPGVGNPGSQGVNRGERNDAGGVSVGGIRVSAVDANSIMRFGGGFVAVLLLLLVALSRYLRPRSVMAVWKRTLTLANLAGAQRRPGETPFEVGRRLQRTFPETSEPVNALANGFVVAAYAPPEVATTARPAVMEAWTSLRPMLIRRVLARLRPTRP